MSSNDAALAASSRMAAGLKPLLLLVGLAAAVAAGVSIVLWSRDPNYSLLFANLDTQDQAQIVQALEAAGIPYRLDANASAISVPSEQVNGARLSLAAQGLPETDGFSLMKESGFGVSQFMENARYQHALEGELARTIASMRPVEGARVHLALPRQSAFVRDRRPASASVFVQLRPGQRLDQQQIQAILNLVASSIPELEASHVTVVDQQGRLLSAPQGDDELAIRTQHLDLAQRLEREYAERIEALLTPIIGEGRVRAQVVTQLDMSVVEEAREQYNPEAQVVRSEQVSQQSSSDPLAAGGVPGTLSNQPPAGGVALMPGEDPADLQPAVAADGSSGAVAAGNSSRQMTRNYEIDRTLAYTKQPAGRLKRLTVAVLVDNIRQVGADGKAQDVPLSAEQIEHITRLVKDAVGYDETRGDSVNVVNAPFRVDTPASESELVKPPIWEHPLVNDGLRVLAGLIVLLVLVFAVIKPLVRSLVGPVRQPALAGASAPAALPAGAASAPALAEPGRAAALSAPQPSPQNDALAFEQQVTHARSLVSQDSKRVAQVVRTWVAQDE